MCRVCFVETGTDEDRCEQHDGKRPSSVIVYVWEPRSSKDENSQLVGERCVIEGTGGEYAIVRFLDSRRRLTVPRRTLRRAA